MCALYPEVMQARIAFEIALEKEAMQNSMPLPADLKNEMWNRMSLSDSAKLVSFAPVVEKKMNWLKYAAAAAVILLAGSLLWNISLYNRNRNLQTEVDNKVAQLADIEKNLDDILMNPTVKTAAMKGMETSPSSSATVYWDSTSKDVYLLVTNLPKPSSDKQYQLWALLNGKPIDVGMIDNEWFIGQKRLLLRMKNVSNAQAFAITLEQKGGSNDPKGPMYTMGNL